MRAIVYTRYGSPSEVLELKEVEKPTPNDEEVLVRILASSINDGDKSLIRGSPFIARFSSGLLRPKYRIPGGDIAGRVEAVGGNVKRFQPGDEVFGDLGASGFGAYAEYVAAPETELALKPVNLTHAEAAAFPQYALVALQGLRDKGQIQLGHKVLINGASGGVGTFAVQIAKSFGAEVTGVCSTRNLELVRSIGADYVIDYTKEDFAKGEQRYDLILDSVANRSLSDYRGALSPEGSYVAVAFNLNALIMGPLTSREGGQKMTQLSHEPSVDDLVYVKGLVEAGKVRPVIDRSFPLEEVVEAFRYFVEGHPSGKVVITMGDEAGEEANQRG